MEKFKLKLFLEIKNHAKVMKLRGLLEVVVELTVSETKIENLLAPLESG